PSRRSSRLENTTLVVYNESVNVKEKKSKREEVVIGEGSRLEVYTEEHEKLLGNTERSWTCFVDGYKDGTRIYDPINGKTCHQCRQKTLGHRIQCSECDMVQGQFCGDCLFMSSRESKLICPVCRGICNCSLCQNHKGWVPTSAIYKRIAQLGYKSFAHYLIQTKRVETDDPSPNEASAKRSLSFQEAKSLPNIAADDENPNSAIRSLSFFSPSVEVSKLQNMDNQNGDSLKKGEGENTNESVDGKTSLVDVQVVGYLEPSKQDKQEHSCAHIGGDLPRIQERTEQNSNLDTRTEQNSNLVTRKDGYFLPRESQTLLVDDVQVQCNEAETRGNAVNTRETRSKRKAALEPNPDSVGGRLRQHRRSQSSL
ncbi:hypothetical protein EUTSA_v10000497mg, partial [Eutrema salsugineum]